MFYQALKCWSWYIVIGSSTNNRIIGFPEWPPWWLIDWLIRWWSTFQLKSLLSLDYFKKDENVGATSKYPSSLMYGGKAIGPWSSVVYGSPVTAVILKYKKQNWKANLKLWCSEEGLTLERPVFFSPYGAENCFVNLWLIYSAFYQPADTANSFCKNYLLTFKFEINLTVCSLGTTK